MKKRLGVLMCAIAFGTSVYAYNPPAGGQNVLRLTEPQLITGANSASGGGIFGVTPASIVINPALTAWEQRITLDAAGTALVSTNSDDDRKLGGAVEGGLLIPSRWCVSTLLFQGAWTEFADMPVGNSINFTAGLAKDITDDVSVGISGNFGLLYGDLTKSDWTASGALGAYYHFGDLGILKGLRFGAALTNLGKMYSNTETAGIKSVYDETYDEVDSWPGIATVRTGVAASLVQERDFELGASFDLAYPAFQDVVVDTGLQLRVKDFLKISSSWEFDVREFSYDAKNILPSVGVSFKFLFKSKEGSYLARKGWAESEMTVSGAWKQMYKSVNAVSAGLVMNLGLEDTKAPEVILWGEE
ncbi:MAG: hypothetical protein J6I53_05880 [Treponema sp.]|nr:hypothetical protein [Treponema sp.]